MIVGLCATLQAYYVTVLCTVCRISSSIGGHNWRTLQRSLPAIAELLVQFSDIKLCYCNSLQKIETLKYWTAKQYLASCKIYIWNENDLDDKPLIIDQWLMTECKVCYNTNNVMTSMSAQCQRMSHCHCVVSLYRVSNCDRHCYCHDVDRCQCLQVSWRDASTRRSLLCCYLVIAPDVSWHIVTSLTVQTKS